jgi:hypothetical protein
VITHEVLKVGRFSALGFPGRILKIETIRAKDVRVVEIPQKTFLKTSFSFAARLILSGMMAVR